MLWITKAVYCQDYKIDLHFNDGKNGTVDLRDTILQNKRPIFQKLRDREHFKKFKVDMGYACMGERIRPCSRISL